MFSRVIKSALSVSMAAIALFAGAAALAQSVQTIQTLDRVDVYNKTKVLEMEFDDPGRTIDFTALGIAPTAGSTGFSACQVTASQALYCIDGKDVVVWPKPAEATGSGTKLFSCADTAALGFDGQPCTGITVDDAGTIWVAGRKPAGAPAASAYAITRVTPNFAGCAKPLPSAAGATAPYCAIEYATGPRAFVGLSPIDGEVGAAFVPGPGKQAGPGVLGHEVTEDVTDPTGGSSLRTVFFPRTPGEPISIGAGATQWSLVPGETLRSVTMLQLSLDPTTGGVVPRGTAGAVTRSFILAATSRYGTPPPGRILAIDTQNPDLGDLTKPVAFQVFDIAAERATASTSFPLATCSSLSQQYGVRASSKSGRVYLTDRTYCQAAALESAAASGTPFALRNVQERPGTDLTFSTTSATTAYPPDAGTIAPGIVVNLSTCGANCVLLSYKDGTPAANLSNVKLVGSKSGMSLFQVKGIPDCRYIDPKPAACLRPDVIVNPTDPVNKQFLNVTPLLPVEVTALFNSSGIPPKGLPRMLISPQYRGQNERGFQFEALFGITDDGVVFQGTFDLLFDVGKLLGNPANKLGCGYDYSEAKKPNLDWDVITTVSERVIAAGGPGLLSDLGNKNRYVDMMVNTGCINPTAGSGARWSMYAYNLEITPNKDDVFAQLLLTLFDDLEETRAELACKQMDTTGAAPLSSKVCSALKTQWSATKIKLDKCYKASVQPKSSAGSENCQAFFTQLKGYQTILNGASTSGPDPANRLGELKARVNVLFHVYSDRFLPSIPANGFTLR